MILPVGISFYTFQTLSYSIDVYKRKLPTCRSALDFAVFVSFFPQLVAGPIVRASDFLPQLENPNPMRFRSVDFFLILRGLFKKVIIADNVSVFADTVLSNPEPWSSVGDLDRCDLFLHPDLLRLLGILRYGDRHRIHAGLQTAAQLQPSLLRAQPARVLASVAHLALGVAARLPLYPARRQPGLGVHGLPKPGADDADRWPLARCELEFRALGWLCTDWCWSSTGCTWASASGEATPLRRACGHACYRSRCFNTGCCSPGFRSASSIRARC